MKTKKIYVSIDVLIDRYAGFDKYFADHPNAEKRFPCVHDKRWYKRFFIKSRDMFIGKKTEILTRLLDILSITVDTAYLEAEYYFTPRGKVKTYKYENGSSSITFDFHTDTSDQLDTCGIILSYPDEKESDIADFIRRLRTASDTVTVYD